MALTPRTPKKRERGKPLKIRPWAGATPLAELAELAEYVGSSEHKDYVNPVLGEPPARESDASRCEEYPADEWPRFTASLRRAIAAGCVAGEDANGFPRYVWGFHDSRMFQARHRTDPPGTRYEGWWIEEEEHPLDPGNRLSELRAQTGES